MFEKFYDSDSYICGAIGDKQTFKTKEDFFNFCKADEEIREYLDELKENTDYERTSDDVETAYCKYCKDLSKEFEWIPEGEGGHLYCDSTDKEAIEVWDLQAEL